jgi:hypothetical protein
MVETGLTVEVMDADGPMSTGVGADEVDDNNGGEGKSFMEET